MYKDQQVSAQIATLAAFFLDAHRDHTPCHERRAGERAECGR
jgi:hypothetical protein